MNTWLGTESVDVLPSPKSHWKVNLLASSILVANVTNKGFAPDLCEATIVTTGDVPVGSSLMSTIIEADANLPGSFTCATSNETVFEPELANICDGLLSVDVLPSPKFHK